MPNPRPCRMCGMSITMIEGPNPGKIIPGQAIRTVYVRDGDKLRKVDLLRLLQEEAERQGEAPPESVEIFVSHFETCPNASEFSGGSSRR